MTSVMPAWKQALIEKKRKKEQEEKVKTQVQNDRVASLPEWKKNLLARKKSLQGGDINHGLDKQTANIGNNTTVSGYDKLGHKRSSFATNSTEREHGSYLGKSTQKVIIIPKENSQDGTQGGVRQHSLVASSGPQSYQQKENKQLEKKLSRNDQEILENQGIVLKDDENNSKVCYEHIKTPSELRKLFGVVSRDSVSTSFTESNKVQNQQTQAHSDVLTKPLRSTSTRDYEQSQKFTANAHPQTSSRETIPMRAKDVELPNSDKLSPAKKEETKFKENNVMIIPKDNDTEISVVAEDADRSKGVKKDEEKPAEVHVQAIRTKFGPSGNFRLHKSSSSDNLLNSNHQPAMSPRSRGKPPPISKRWSADVGGILSPTRSISDDEDIFDLGHNDNNMKRMRSKSMGDVRIVDHHVQDFEPVVNLKHRASISSGIERRLQVLLHNLSVADGKNDDYEEVDDVENTNICSDQNVRDHFQDDHKSTSISAGSSGKQMDENIPRIRKTAWFNQENDSTDTDLLLTYKDYDFNEKPAVKSTISQSLSHDFNKSSDVQEKIEARNLDFGKNKEVTDDKKKQNHNLEVSLSNHAPLISDAPQKTKLMNGKMANKPIYIDSESEKDEKPAKGSVSKLSSLFGSSISKGSKKDKSKSNDNAATSKSSKEQHLNKENKSKTEKKDSQKSSSSRIFPWSKKQKKSVPVKDVKEEQAKPFSGASSLRPVQHDVVEQKITGKMTLVINANAGSYKPKSKQKQPQLHSANQAPGMGDLDLSTQNAQGDMSSTKYKNQNKPSLAVHKPDDMMVTVIDVPDPSSNDVEVSTIDLPEPPSPTPVSVIDIPESPEHDIKVSVIDMPDEEADSDDSDDSDSSGSGMSGSYDINPVSTLGVYTINENSEGEEEEEDIDNVPVSYFGDSTYMKVPEVIFESEVENVKSCLSSPLHSRKRKAKVAFDANKLEKIHDYPSEVCMQYHFDQYSKENGGKTIDQYRPPSLQGLEKSHQRETEKETATDNNNKVFKSSDNTESKDEYDAPTITYLDEGKAFTSSSSSGALLF